MGFEAIKYALIAVTMNGGHADTQVVMRGWETLAECEASATNWERTSNPLRYARALPPSKFVCIPDHGEKDDALLRSMK
jgi:hypothetical protein